VPPESALGNVWMVAMPAAELHRVTLNSCTIMPVASEYTPTCHARRAAAHGGAKRTREPPLRSTPLRTSTALRTDTSPGTVLAPRLAWTPRTRLHLRTSCRRSGGERVWEARGVACEMLRGGL
jgi:hypothetical protein